MRELTSSQLGAPIDTRDASEGDGLVYRSGEFVAESIESGGTLIATYTPSAASSIDIALPPGYRGFRMFGTLIFSAGHPTEIHARMGDGTLDTGSNYDWARTTGGDSTSISAGDGDTKILLGFADGEDQPFDITIFPGYDDAAIRANITCNSFTAIGTTQASRYHMGRYMVDAAVDLLSIFPASGTVTGTIHVYALAVEGQGQLLAGSATTPPKLYGSMQLTSDLTTTETPIAWDATVEDVGGVVDLANNRFVAVTSGWKLVTFLAQWGSTLPDDMSITIRVNGTDLGGGRRLVNRHEALSGEDFRGVTGTMAFWTEAGDNIDFAAGGSQVSLRGNASTSLATIVTYSELTGDTALKSSWSPILDHKPTTDTPDDDFDSTTLDGKWTVVNGSSGTVDFLETGNVSKYDLTTRPGWLLMQTGHGGSDAVRLRQDYTLPDGASLIMALSPGVTLDGSLGDSELNTGLRLDDSDTWNGSTNIAHLQVLAGSALTPERFTVRFWDGTVATETELYLSNEMIYLRLSRSGTAYYGSFSFDGASWTHIASADHSTALTDIWVHAHQTVAGSDPVGIQAIDWIRQGTNTLDPWPHSGLVKLGVGGVDPWAGLGSALYAPDANEDVEFISNSKGVPPALTEVVESGDDRGDWYESGGVLHYRHKTSGTGTRDLHAAVRSMSLSAGDYVETAVRLNVRQNYFGVGLVMSDGTTFGSGDQVVTFLHGGGDELRFNRLNGFSSWNTADAVGTSFDNIDYHKDCFTWIRLKYESANTFGLYISKDGLEWHTIQNNYSKTLTPTHAGVVVVHWDNPSAIGGWARFFHLRKNPSY